MKSEIVLLVLVIVGVLGRAGWLVYKPAPCNDDFKVCPNGKYFTITYHEILSLPFYFTVSFPQLTFLTLTTSSSATSFLSLPPFPPPKYLSLYLTTPHFLLARGQH